MSTPPPIVGDETPAPSKTAFPTRTSVDVESVSILKTKYGPLLIVGIVFICLIIIITILTVVIIHFRKKKNQIYAEEDNPSDDNDAGKVDIVSVYKLQD